MSTMHHHHAQRPSPFEIGELADFDAALGDAPEPEKRRKRIAYLRDGVRQMQMGANMMKGFGCFLIPFAIIPIFWPFLFFFWFMKKKSTALMASQLTGALEYWGIGHEELSGTGNPHTIDLG